MKKNTCFTIEREDTLLPFLTANLRGQSRNNIKALLTYRQILVDGEPVGQHNFALKPGMRVEILWDKPRGGQDELAIIYEDENIIAVNKPAGLLSIATEREKERTAYHMLTDYVQKRDPKARVFVVHRLDRDTSGVFLVAKSVEAKHALQDRWNELVSRREYVAVVEGCPEKERDTIRSNLRETKTHLVYSSESGGTPAVTNYELLKRGEHYSMLRVQITTGRKNQIRVHMHDIAHPVAGDRKYGAKSSPIGRLALHASVLEFLNPFTGAMLTLTANIPKSFYKLLKM